MNQRRLSFGFIAFIGKRTPLPALPHNDEPKQERKTPGMMNLGCFRDCVCCVSSVWIIQTGWVGL